MVVMHQIRDAAMHLAFTMTRFIGFITAANDARLLLS